MKNDGANADSSIVVPAVQARGFRRYAALTLAIACLKIGAIPIACAGDDWRGNALMTGGKGYVSTPMGQVHYRDRGPESTQPPLLLLHQSPMNMIEYARIQDELAILGARSIAIDTPGYGMSDTPQGEPSVKNFGDNIRAVLDGLKLKKVVVAGYHTGASIAVSFAANHPEQVTGIILHGTPLFNEQELAERSRRPAYDRTPVPDGSHLSRLFSGHDPKTQTSERLETRTYVVLSMFTSAKDVGHSAVYQYRMEHDAKAIKAPGLLLSDVSDTLHYLDQRMAALRPDFQYLEFPADQSLSLMHEPKKWAKIAADFVAKVTKEAQETSNAAQ